MPINVGKLDWSNWFEMEPRPSWPKELTKAYWDKKKSLTAKTISTGLGQQLAETQKAFEAALKEAPSFTARNMDEFARYEQRVLAFATGGTIKRLHTELKQLRDTAEAAAETLRASKLPGLKSTIALCEDIGDAADKLMVACNVNSMRGYAVASGRARAALIHKKATEMVKYSLNACRGVPSKVLGILDDVEAQLDIVVERQKNAEQEGGDEEITEAWDALRAVLSTVLTDVARDMTQPLGNIRKAMQAGVVFEGVTPQEVDELCKILVPYGHRNMALCTNADEAEIRTKIALLREAAERFGRFSKTIRLASL